MQSWGNPCPSSSSHRSCSQNIRWWKVMLPKLKTIMSELAPLGPELAEDCARRLGCTVKQGYGLTETSPVTHLNPEPPDVWFQDPSSICIPNTECRIVDYETGEDLGTGMGWALDPGTQGDERLSEQRRSNEPDDRSWRLAKNRRYCRSDEDGYFKIVDRVKELIKYKGVRLHLRIGGIAVDPSLNCRLAVVPAEDPEAGEIPVGFVVYKENMVENPETIMEFIAQKVSPQKIRRIIQIEQIPNLPPARLAKALRDQIAWFFDHFSMTSSWFKVLEISDVPDLIWVGLRLWYYLFKFWIILVFSIQCSVEQKKSFILFHKNPLIFLRICLFEKWSMNDGKKISWTWNSKILMFQQPNLKP